MLPVSTLTKSRIKPSYTHCKYSYAMSSIGNRVREARKAAGFSQPELAAQIGCSASALSQIESDKTKAPRAFVILGVAKHTGYSATWITSGKGDKLASAPEAKARQLYEGIMSLPDEVREKLIADVEFFSQMQND